MSPGRTRWCRNLRNLMPRRRIESGCIDRKGKVAKRVGLDHEEKKRGTEGLRVLKKRSSRLRVCSESSTRLEWSVRGNQHVTAGCHVAQLRLHPPAFLLLLSCSLSSCLALLILILLFGSPPCSLCSLALALLLALLLFLSCSLFRSLDLLLSVLLMLMLSQSLLLMLSQSLLLMLSCLLSHSHSRSPLHPVALAFSFAVVLSPSLSPSLLS